MVVGIEWGGSFKKKKKGQMKFTISSKLHFDKKKKERVCCKFHLKWNNDNQMGINMNLNENWFNSIQIN